MTSLTYSSSLKPVPASSAVIGAETSAAKGSPPSLSSPTVRRRARTAAAQPQCPRCAGCLPPCRRCMASTGVHCCRCNASSLAGQLVPQRLCAQALLAGSCPEQLAKGARIAPSQRFVCRHYNCSASTHMSLISGALSRKQDWIAQDVLFEQPVLLDCRLEPPEGV